MITHIFSTSSSRSSKIVDAIYFSIFSALQLPGARERNKQIVRKVRRHHLFGKTRYRVLLNIIDREELGKAGDVEDFLDVGPQ
jgi:hypothetical protein